LVLAFCALVASLSLFSESPEPSSPLDGLMPEEYSALIGFLDEADQAFLTIDQKLEKADKHFEKVDESLTMADKKLATVEKQLQQDARRLRLLETSCVVLGIAVLAEGLILIFK
jgi:Skp family chaperone for outer membrane proteins